MLHLFRKPILLSNHLNERKLLLRPIHIAFLVLIVLAQNFERRKIVLRGTNDFFQPSQAVFGNLQIVLEILNGVADNRRGSLCLQFDFAAQIDKTVNAPNNVTALLSRMFRVFLGKFA